MAYHTETFKSTLNPDIGIAINWDDKVKNQFEVWEDRYEGGEAYITDWYYVETFKTYDEVLGYIKDSYGDVSEI